MDSEGVSPEIIIGTLLSALGTIGGLFYKQIDRERQELRKERDEALARLRAYEDLAPQIKELVGSWLDSQDAAPPPRRSYSSGDSRQRSIPSRRSSIPEEGVNR
jgi:hypothetical protein